MRKIRADKVFDGRWMHSGGLLLLEEDGTVLDLLLPAEADDRQGTATGQFPAPGPQPAIPGLQPEVPGRYHASELSDAEYFEGVLAPGFINAHCHLELSHLKGKVTQGTGLVDFILQVQRNRQAAGDAAAEKILAAMEAAEAEMRAAGIVGVGDISNSAVSFPLKRRPGLRYHTFIEVFGFDPAKAEALYSGARELLAAVPDFIPDGDPAVAAFNSTAAARPAAAGGDRTPGISAGIVPHSPYSVSRELFRRIAAGASGTDTPLFSIHNQESAHEDPFYLDGSGDLERLYRELGIDISFYSPYGARALPTWFPWLGEAGSTYRKLLVHNTYTRPADVEAARAQVDVWWCLCPNANLYIEQRLPDIPMFAEKGLDLLLGTDSLASNHSLSIFEEMRTVSLHFPDIGLEQLLQWATWNGARFFGWDDLGRFGQGSRPGVNWLKDLEGGRIGKRSAVVPLF